MLTRLVINDVVLIDRLNLSLTPGLNVFTGETGAGKSILLDALGLALGARSDAGLIRHGETQASVMAEFALDPDHDVLAFLKTQGLQADLPLILRRLVSKDGKSRAFINDQPISIGLLKQVGEQLLEIHGQFETHGLLDPSTHRGLLDAFASLDGERGKTATLFEHWKTTALELKAAEQELAKTAAETEFLRASLHELEDLEPEQGEVERLALSRTSLQNREKILDALQGATQALEGQRGALANLSQAGKSVAKVVDKTPHLQDLLAAIDRSASEGAEAANLLHRAVAEIDAEPDALQNIETRLFALRAVARKHGVDVDALSKLKDDFSSRLTRLDEGGDQIAALKKTHKEAHNRFTEIARLLSEQRKSASVKLAKAINIELPPLKLDQARLIVEVTQLPEDQWSAEGMDKVIFLATTNPGTAPGLLHKIASGGELARFMLALKVVLAASDPVPTMVFDEVDAGIGGATASAVGQRLGRLAQHLQILVVTHSPQVAARGAHHMRVIKRMKGTAVTTAVEILDPEQRQEEIARMLAGSEVTDAARKAAISLLNDQEASLKPKLLKRASR